MIKAIAQYKVEDKASFCRKVSPYIYGSGQYYPESITDIRWSNNKSVEAIIVATSISQFINAATGMLRFSSGASLEDIDVKECTTNMVRKSRLFPESKIISGVILKPASANLKIHYKLIDLSIKSGFDFVKDDDIVEFSASRVKKLYKFCGKRIIYFHKNSKQEQFSNHPTMIIPWIDGWSLAEMFNKSKKAPLLIHCSNTPLQISWSVYIILARLAGASFVIVPDSKFDKSANLRKMIEAASRKIRYLSPITLIVAGAVTPKRIKEIKRSIDKKFYSLMGFAIGSWFTKFLQIK